MTVALRDYQAAGLAEVRRLMAGGCRRVLRVLPTGGGKTVEFCHLAHSVSGRGKRALILVHREELVNQVVESLEREGVTAGVIHPAWPFAPLYPIQVGSVYTVANRIGQIYAPDLVIVDEAHHSAAKTWGKVLSAWPAAYILGVTATPQRLDGKGLKPWFDGLVVGPQITDLISAGHLVQPVVYAPPGNLDLSSVRTTAGDYNRADMSGAIQRSTITGDAVDHYLRLTPGRRAVVFCHSVAAAEELAAKFRESGITAESIDGSLDRSERARRIKRFRSGHTLVLTTCDLVSEGFDLPDIEVAILLRPTKSLSLYLQQVGRALRPMPGKREAIILDHVGNVDRFGLPDDQRDWQLTEDKPKGNGKCPYPPKRCPQCHMMLHPAKRQCPACGHIFPAAKKRGAEQKAGDLQARQRRDPEQIQPEEWKTMPYWEAIKLCRTEHHLRKMALARGYSSGWVWHIMNSRKAAGAEVAR